MVELGIRPTVPWGHQKGAVPVDGTDPEAVKFANSRYNAGYVEGGRVNPKTGATQLLVSVPGAEFKDGNLVTDVELGNGMKVKGAIGEVSAKIVPSWKDGRGRVWKDTITHLALVPLPVVTGQKGFEPEGAKELATLAAVSDPTELYLGRTTVLYTLAAGVTMDKPDDLDLEDDEAEPAPSIKPAADEGAGKAPAKKPADAEFAHALQFLAKPHPNGIHLPPGTTPENLCERICVIGHHAEEAGEDDESEGGEGGGYGGEGMQSGGGGGTVEEAQRPIMMSTIPEDDPMTRRLFGEKQEGYRSRALRKIDRMARVEGGDVPFMPPEKAAAMRSGYMSYELATTPEGDVIEKKQDIELAAWWEAYQTSTQARKAMAKGGKQRRRPDERREGDEGGKVDEKDIEARAARVS